MKLPFATTLFCLALGGLAGAQATYSYRTFENPGATVTLVFGLNARGEMVGTDNTIPGRHAFLLGHQNYVSLDASGTLGTQFSFARGINDLGDVVGDYFDNDGNEHGFLLKHDVLTTIDVPFPGSLGTQLNAINDSGVIVGTWVDEAVTAHGFVYQNGNFAHLDFPGALDTFPSGINARGEIVGNWDTDQSTIGHGFLFYQGQIGLDRCSRCRSRWNRSQCRERARTDRWSVRRPRRWFSRLSSRRLKVHDFGLPVRL